MRLQRLLQSFMPRITSTGISLRIWLTLFEVKNTSRTWKWRGLRRYIGGTLKYNYVSANSFSKGSPAGLENYNLRRRSSKEPSKSSHDMSSCFLSQNIDSSNLEPPGYGPSLRICLALLFPECNVSIIFSTSVSEGNKATNVETGAYSFYIRLVEFSSWNDPVISSDNTSKKRASSRDRITANHSGRVSC